MGSRESRGGGWDSLAGVFYSGRGGVEMERKVKGEKLCTW